MSLQKCQENTIKGQSNGRTEVCQVLPPLLYIKIYRFLVVNIISNQIHASYFFCNYNDSREMPCCTFLLIFLWAKQLYK